MPFDVDGAKKAGYSDDEIQTHLKSVYPKFDFDSARKAGYSLNEIANHLTQGGEKSNEDQKPSQSQAYQDRNAGREADQQEPPVRSETGIQADGLLRPEDQSQRERNDQTSVSDEGQTQDAQGGIQGAQAGEGLEGQVPAGNQEEVETGGVLPSPVEIASKAVEAGKNLVDFHIKAFPAIRDFGAAALSSIGQSLYGAGAGLARTEPEYIDLPSYGVKVKNPRYKESKELVDFFEKQKAGAAEFPEALGAKPLTGVEKTAAEVTGGLLKLPAQILTGPLGMGSLLAEAFGSSKEQFYQKAKQEGLSDEQAINKADFNATASTAAALPLYHVGGIGARIGAEKLVAETAPKLAKMATQFGLNTVANTVASAASRGITAALSGESITDAMKDVTVPGVIQDIAFAAHSSVTHFQEQAAKGNAKEAARDLSDPALEQVAQDPRYADAVAPEVKARAESRVAQESPQANLPETGKVLEVSSEAERAAAPEAPVEEPPAEAPTEAQPTEPTPQGERKGEEEVAPLAAESAIEEAPSWRDMPDRPYGESVFVHDEKSAGTKQNPIIIGDQLFFKDKGIWNYKSTSIGGPFGKNEWLRMTDPKSSQKVEDWYQKYGKSKQSEVTTPQGARIASAAYLASDGNVYEGPDHISAMGKAKKAGAITQDEIDAKQAPESRNTDEFGFKVTMPDGTAQVTTREAAGQIAKKSGQALEEQFVHGDKMHSNETRMDEYNHLGEKQVSPKAFAQDPVTTMQEAIPEPTEENLQKSQLTRPDARSLGIVPKGTAETNFLIDSVINKVKEIVDSVKYRGKNIKELRKAGVEDEANQHAAARIYVPVHVEELLGKVFGDTKDIEKMRPTMDILVKDDIVGGYEDIVKQVNDLEAERAKAQSEGRPTKAIENKIEAISKRGRDIEEAHPIEQYKQDIENASPEIQGNIQRWKDNVVSEMDSLYNELKNVDPSTPREGRGWKFGARLNLLSKTEEEKMASYGDLDKPIPTASVSNYRNPNVKRDKFMQKASFLGDYSTDPVAILTNSLASRWNEVTKIRFYKALEDKGVGKIVAPGEEAPTMIGGKEVDRLPIKFPETDPATGITRVVEHNLYVQKPLVEQIRKVLDVDSKPTQNPFAKAFTGIQILGIADATAHLKNLQNVTRNALGRDSAWKDLTAKIPFLGQAQSVKEIASVAKDVASNGKDIRSEKAYLAKIGALRPFYPAEGIQRFLGTHQLLHDVDTATRIILNRRYDELIKRYGAIDTESARRDFINQVGNYNRRLMGRWETLARDTGLSPFIVAGRAMNRYARKMVTGDPGFKTDNVKGAIAARAAQISSLAFASLIPSITNMFTTGSPFGRQGTPIGAIDFGPNYDTEDGKRRTFDVFALTGLRRGLRQFGIDSAIDGARTGKDLRDIERDMANGVITTKMHPWIGPAVGLGQETLTGKRFDLRTGYSQRYEARKIEGFGQYVENFRIALKQLNPLLYGITGRGIEWAMKDVAGIPEPSEERNSKENLGLISKATGAPQIIGEIEGALEKPVLGAVGYKENQSEAVKLANSFGEAVQFTPEQDQRFTYRRKIKEALSKGDKKSAKDLYDQGFNDGILTEADKKSIGRYIKYPDKIVQKVQMLKTADEAVRVWRVSTTQEQDAIADLVANKIANSTTLRPEEKKKLANTFFASAKPNTEAYEVAKRRKKK